MDTKDHQEDADLRDLLVEMVKMEYLDPQDAPETQDPQERLSWPHKEAKDPLSDHNQYYSLAHQAHQDIQVLPVPQVHMVHQVPQEN